MKKSEGKPYWLFGYLVLAGGIICLSVMNYQLHNRILQTKSTFLPVGINIIKKTGETIDFVVGSEEMYLNLLKEYGHSSSKAIVDEFGKHKGYIVTEKDVPTFGIVDFTVYTKMRGCEMELPQRNHPNPWVRPFLGEKWYQYNFDGLKFKFKRIWIWTGKRWIEEENNNK